MDKLRSGLINLLLFFGSCAALFIICESVLYFFPVTEHAWKDKFVLEYMNTIGHYEFGKNHKVFFNSNIHNDNLGDVNYWLYQWIKVYGYLLDLRKKDKDSNNVSFLSYEKLTQNTASLNRG